MRKRMMDWCAAGLILPCVPACGGSDGENGKSGRDGAPALIETADEPMGDNCVDGGIQISYGTDTNGDGALNTSEIDGTRYVCNGSMAAGPTGPDGATGAPGPKGAIGATGASGPAGVTGASGPAGAMGATGAAGPTGAVGPTGAAGPSGAAGPTGATGATGSTGAAGFQSLISIGTEAPGINCSLGGLKVSAGIDNGDGGGTANDGVLQAGEIDQTSYLCSGQVKRVFITSTKQTAALGGLAGADTICQTLANAQSLGGTWKAWLSDSKISAAQRLSHNSLPYVLLDGSPVAANWNALISGAITQPITINEMGASVVGDGVWTATKADGTYYGSEACADWTSTVGNGRYGGSPFSNGGWTDFNSLTCTLQLYLYCFEQ